jgi:hypothetical protein
LGLNELITIESFSRLGMAGFLQEAKLAGNLRMQRRVIYAQCEADFACPTLGDPSERHSMAKLSAFTGKPVCLHSCAPKLARAT